MGCWFHSLRFLKASLACLLALSGLLTIAPASGTPEAIEFNESFLDYTGAFYPPLPLEARVPGWTYSLTGSTSNTVNLAPSPTDPGTTTLHIGSFSTTSTSSLTWQAPSIGFGRDFLCDDSEYTEVFGFQFYLDALATTTGTVTPEIQFGLNTDDSSRWYIDVTGADIDAFVSTDSGGFASVDLGSVVEDQWYTVTFASFDCANEYFQVSVTGNGGANAALIDGVSLAGAMDGPDGFDVRINTAGTATKTVPNVYLNTITGTAYVEPPTPAGFRFCSNPLEASNAYTYKRGGDYFDQGTGEGPGVSGIGLSTGYLFEGGTAESDWDYSAKQFTVGSEAMRANLTIEAGTDGSGSVFRVSFNTVSGATPDATTKGNGLTTGNFANHAEAEFTENGDRWQIKLWYVTGGGTRTQLGPAVNHGSSNDARTYSVWSDNTGTDPWIAVKDSAGATVISSNSTAPGTLATFQTAFSGDEIFDIWFIGYGDGGVLGSSLANTAIDQNEATAGNSTCMFDDTGTAVAQGSGGTAPQDVVPPDVGGPDEEEDTFFNGVTETALMGFLGIVLVASFAATMNEKTNAGGTGLAIFSLLGLFVAYFLNYIDGWVVVVLGVMGAAVVFFGVKNAATGGEL